MSRAPDLVTYEIEPDFAARQSVLWSIAWLVGGVTVMLATHVVLIYPELAGDLGFLSYGRLRGVADTAIVFGWLGTVAFAAIFALLPRITEVQLHNEVLGAATSLTWAVVLTFGVLAILLGFNQGLPWGEMPAPIDAAVVILFAFALYNAAVTAVRRRERTLYVSGWFLLSAALLAPLIYTVGNLPFFTGVTESIVNGFYRNGLEMLWLLPVSLGIAHYVVPVETGSPLYSGALARTSFWSLMFAGGWAGQRFYLQGPAPDFLDTIAVAMTFVLAVPALTAAANLYATGKDRWHLVSKAFGLRFAATGLGFLIAWIALVTLTTTPSVYRFVGLTAWDAGVRHLAIFGVFSSFAFALIYHVYPLMVGRDWYSRSLASVHFWVTTGGVVAGTALMMATGAYQASAAVFGDQVAEGPHFIVVLRILTAIAFAAVVVAQYAFAYNTSRTARSGPLVEVLPASAPAVGAAR